MANTKTVPLSSHRADDLADVLKGIAHPLRLRIITLLCERDHTVTELTDALDSRQSLVSQHLSPLRLLGLVSVDRRGGRATYSLGEPHLRTLVDCLMGCRGNQR